MADTLRGMVERTGLHRQVTRQDPPSPFGLRRGKQPRFPRALAHSEVEALYSPRGLLAALPIFLDRPRNAGAKEKS